MKVYFWAILSIFSFFSFPVGAQVCGEDCTTPPTCSQLGYKKGLTCPEGGIICPFDASYKWCKEYTCDDGRYYSSPLAGDYTCAKVEYHGLTCYDCVATAEEVSCSVTDEQSLVEALQCDDCPVVTVLNNITITNSLPDLKEGQTLKAADGQTYTISVNPSGDIQTSDPEFEISQDGQTMKMKLSQLFGAAPGIILTTAAGSRIDNIHFKVAATHNVDAVIVPLGDTTFNNLSIVIDGKDEESERMLSAGILPINPGGKFAFEGDTYIEMKNIKGRQMAGGVLDFLSMASPETAASITVDNIDILQENINSENIYGLISSNLDVTGDIGILQENIGGGNLEGLSLNLLNVTGDVTITQNKNNVNDSLIGMDFQNLTLTKAGAQIIVNQHNNSTKFKLIGLKFTQNAKIFADDAEIIINQDGNNGSTGIEMSRGATIENTDISINQTNNNGPITGIDVNFGSIIITGDPLVTINQTNNIVLQGLYGINGNLTSDGNGVLTINQINNNIVANVVYGISGNTVFSDIRIVQEDLIKSTTSSSANITALYTHELQSDSIDIRQIGNDFAGSFSGLNAYTNAQIGIIKIEQQDNVNMEDSTNNTFGIRVSDNFQADTVEIIQNGYTYQTMDGGSNIYGFFASAVAKDVNIGHISVTQTDWRLAAINSGYVGLFGINGGSYENAVVTQNNIVFEHPTFSTIYCYYTLSALASHTTGRTLSINNSAIINQGQFADNTPMCQYVIYGTASINKMTVDRQCGSLASDNNYTITDLTDNYTPCK